MTSGPPAEGEARTAAIEAVLPELQRQLAVRVASHGGIPTFYDKWVESALAGLARSEPSARATQERHANILTRVRTREQAGRFTDPIVRLRSERAASELPAWSLITSQGMGSCLRWRGQPLLKSIFDIGIYLMLLQDLQPRTIVELGSGSGASAAWFADTLRSVGVDSTVYSIDLVAPEITVPGVIFRQGDCASIDRVFDDIQLPDLPRPWIVVEDAHANVAGVLRALHNELRVGDYLVVEDSRQKRRELYEFCALTKAYHIDAQYTDLFGQNATSAADSIFVRVC